VIDIRGALRERLLGDSTISTLVGATRIYPGIVPQGISQIGTSQPSLVQNLITEQTDYHMAGPSGLVSMRVQIDAWAKTPDEAVNLANRVKDRLSGFSGTITWGDSTPQNSVAIQGIFAENGRDGYDDVAKMHRRGRDFIVWYGE
jgi:hypothetical protein